MDRWIIRFRRPWWLTRRGSTSTAHTIRTSRRGTGSGPWSCCWRARWWSWPPASASAAADPFAPAVLVPGPLSSSSSPGIDPSRLYFFKIASNFFYLHENLQIYKEFVGNLKLSVLRFRLSWHLLIDVDPCLTFLVIKYFTMHFF